MVSHMGMTTPESPSPPPRRRWKRRILWGVLGLVIAVWVLHPIVLSAILRWGMSQGVGMVGWQVEIGRLEASVVHPWVLQDVRLWAKDAQKSRTDVVVDRMEVIFNAPWEKFDGESRFIDKATVNGIRGIFDLRPEAMPPPYMPDLSPEEQKQMADTIMQFLPISAHVRSADLEFLAPGQSYRLVGGIADFEEGKTGLLTIKEGFVRAGQVNIDTGPLSTVTGWSDGTATLTDLVFREDLKVNLFRARFANVGGIALDLDATIFGGDLSGEIIFNTQNDLPAMDTYWDMVGFDLSAVSAFLSLEPPLFGTLEKARYAFRGIPEKIWNAESSLDAKLLNPRWQGRSCELVDISVKQRLREVTLSRFFVKLGENTFSMEGEASLDEKGEFDVKASPFAVRSKGVFGEVSQLSYVAGPEISQLSGQIELEANANRKDGQIDGSLRLEGKGLAFSAQPIEEAHLEINCADNQASITRLEIKSGVDFFRAAGQVGLSEPYSYSGEWSAHILEIASYLELLRNPSTASIYSGTVDGHWIGRGSATEHWGDLELSVRDLFSEPTPAGLSGQLYGSYSPEAIEVKNLLLNHQNLHFSTQARLDHQGVTVDQGSLTTGTTQLASANLFLPLDTFAMIQGKPLRQAWAADGEVRATISSKGPLKIGDLMKLAGQSLPLTGNATFDLQASGKLTDLSLTGDFRGRDLTMSIEGTNIPPATFDASLKANGGIARLNGSLSTQGMPPLTFISETPFGFAWTPQDELLWANPDGRIKAQISVPQTDLAVFQPLVPTIKRLKGTLSGGVSVTGTMAKPQMNGQLTLAGGILQVASRAPVIGNLQGVLRFNAERADLEKLSGELAAGPFTMKGGVSFADPQNLRYDLSLTGQKLLLARDAGLRLRANVNLEAKGDNNGGSVRGEVAFVDGRIYRRLEITPLLVPSPVGGPLFVPPEMTGLVPPPFGKWGVDIHIKNETPFKLVGNIASGEIVPDLRITGTLGNPVPIGRIELKEARAFLPFSTLRIQGGHLDFVAAAPWVPQLDVRGVVQTQDYTVQAYAYGPLNDHRLVLRADPPLPQESIVLLLTTGFVPGIYAGAGFGEAAIGQGGMLLLRAILRQFEPEGVDVDSFMNRLQITATPPQAEGEGSGLRGRFEIWKGISAMSERDSFGYYNVGATYTFRFK